MAVQPGAFNDMLALIEVIADQDRARQYLLDLKRITDDAGREAARLEANRRSDEFDQREVALDRRASDLQQVAAELDARAATGLEVDRRVRSLDDRERDLNQRAAALDELAAKLDQHAADLRVKEKDLNRRLSLLKQAAVSAA